jgi:hypothetical protein
MALGREPGTIAGGLVAAVAVAGLVLLAGPQSVLDYAQQHGRLLAGLAAIAILAAALAGGLVLYLRGARE